MKQTPLLFTEFYYVTASTQATHSCFQHYSNNGPVSSSQPGFHSTLLFTLLLLLSLPATSSIGIHTKAFSHLCNDVVVVGNRLR